LPLPNAPAQLRENALSVADAETAAAITDLIAYEAISRACALVEAEERGEEDEWEEEAASERARAPAAVPVGERRAAACALLKSVADAADACGDTDNVNYAERALRTLMKAGKGPPRRA